MGTSELSENILSALIKNKYNIVGVFTKPDKKIGREQELSSPAVKILAEKSNIPIFQPEKFDTEAISTLEKLKPDLVIVAAYGRLLPKKALDIPGFGCLNIHVSLLPKYRGPSPIQNSILSGESETGITLILMNEHIDAGDILVQETVAIDPNDNAGNLMQKLSKTGADLMLKTIPLWIERKITPQPQNHSLATFCQMIEREDGHIYWSDDALMIYNRYRALNPWPGIFSFWRKDSELIRLKLLSISLQKTNPQQKYNEGEIFEIGDDVAVQTANGIIIIKEIQKEGKKPVSVKEFINGHPDFIGSILN
jgi:methionyl-tRNA formyltransferase